jgi:hypothetical protein
MQSKISYIQTLASSPEDNTDESAKICKWFLPCTEENPVVLQGILFSDEANFCINGKVDKQNIHC